MREFSVDVTNADSVEAVVLKTTGSINSNTAPTLDGHFDELIAKKQYTIIVDLSETDFISSSGIGVLLGTVTELRDKGGDLILMGIPKLIEDILVILNIKDYFRTIRSLDELEATSKS